MIQAPGFRAPFFDFAFPPATRSPRIRAVNTCPRCRFPLAEIAIDPVRVDRCHRCGGAFFEHGEAGQAFGPLLDGRSLLDGPAHVVLTASELACPRDETPLVCCRLAPDVEVEICASCHGFWLDDGEGPRLADILEVDHQKEMQAESRRANALVYLFQLFTQLPIEVYNPMRRVPWFVLSVIGATAVCFGLEFLLGDRIVEPLALFPAQVLRGRALWGLVTYGLLHANLLHILSNLYALYVFGDNVEDRLGRVRCAVILTTSVVVGGLAQSLAAREGAVIGLSGGVAGFMGAYLVLFPRVKLWLVLLFVRFKVRAIVYLLAWLSLQAIAAASHATGVGWFAHLGGFATGVAIGLIMRRQRPWLPRSRRSALPPQPPASATLGS